MCVSVHWDQSSSSKNTETAQWTNRVREKATQNGVRYGNSEQHMNCNKWGQRKGDEGCSVKRQRSWVAWSEGKTDRQASEEGIDAVSLLFPLPFLTGSKALIE